MRKTIFLDLDGVIVDFCGGVYEWFGLDATDEDVTSWNAIIDLTGKDTVAFWESICNRDFWFGLKKYDHADELLELMDDIPANVIILTSPAMHTAGWKQDWIQEHLPDYNFLIGPDKQCCAGPNKWLIDDYDVNCKEFEMAGGNAINFPQPWNPNRKIKGKKNKIQYIIDSLYADNLL